MQKKLFTRPAVSKGKRWYIYFYFQHPDHPEIPLVHDLNRYRDYQGFAGITTRKQRETEAKDRIAAYNELLNKGWNPWTGALENKAKEDLSLEEAYKRIE